MDDNLHTRGCIMVSICSLYGATMESSYHLFFSCIFARQLWSSILSPFIQYFSCCDSSVILNLLSMTWIAQVADVLPAVITYVLWGIWHACEKICKVQEQNVFLSLHRQFCMQVLSSPKPFQRGWCTLLCPKIVPWNLRNRWKICISLGCIFAFHTSLKKAIHVQIL